MRESSSVMPGHIGHALVIGCVSVVGNVSPPLARRASRLASPRQLSYLVYSRAAWWFPFCGVPVHGT